MFVHTLISTVKQRWRAPGGYREVLGIAFPLILSTGSITVQHFVDRMFLTWYSPETIAAAVPAGILNFTVISLFMGTASYTSTFVAQYHGSRSYGRIGSTLWQGVYVALIAGIVHLALIPLAGVIFTAIGHEPVIREYEIGYFRVLCLGAMPFVAASALSGFYTGLGKTWPVMWINIIATAVHLLLAYLLVFGNYGFPRLGIIGAGISTVASSFVALGLYLLLLMRPACNRLYHTVRDWRFNRELFGGLLRFGFPNGIQFFIDVAGFTVFILIVGRLGTVSLAASNIAMNINMLSFMPMLGFSITVSVLVGQYLGSNQPGRAAYSAFSGFHLTLIYMLCIAAIYVWAPEWLLDPFSAHAEHASFGQIRAIAIVLLRFIAVYSVFDALNLVFASAIKGAGDTRFVMYTIGIVSVLVLIVPSYLALLVFDLGVYSGWLFATLYVCMLGSIFFFRFLGGKWKSMRVI